MKVAEWESQERCIALGEYMLEKRATVRSTAQVFGVSKSTVHKDVTEVLKSVNKALYREVQELLLQNKQDRHLRGGEATRMKYCELHKETENN